MLTVGFVHAVPRLKCGCSLRTADAVACRPHGLEAANINVLVLWQKLVMHCTAAALKLMMSAVLHLIVPDNVRQWCHSSSCLYR